MTDDGAQKTRRTNCGRPIHRFKYERDHVSLTLPCHESTCRTCLAKQPYVSMFETAAVALPTCSSVSSPAPTMTSFDEDDTKPLLLPFRPRVAEKKQAPAWLRRREKKAQTPSKRYELRSSAIAKLEPLVHKFGRCSKDFFDACTQPKKVWRLVIEKEKLRMRRLTVLRFKKRKEEYRKLVERCDGVPSQEKRLVLVIKGDKLRCRWKW
ncbi:hypothetical protein IWX49DRAFT_591716 [Phyllosticta citricarpa]|uniref:Uncharacterized protein n=2 Tax=Phyllosticta TaxID=121621 RepID=A0ABR1M7Q3_9PEZI